MPIEKLLDSTEYPPGDPEKLYEDLSFHGPVPDGRPYLFVNMVSTVCGKTLIAERGNTARGLGGPTDQLLMRRLQGAADAIIVGSGTLRAGNIIYDPNRWRITLSRTGKLPLSNRFFTDAPDRAIVFCPGTVASEDRTRLERVCKLKIVGDKEIDFSAMLSVVRKELGIERLLLEGGPDLNAEFLQRELIDEFFLTLAPKLKGGRDLPTVIDGMALPGRETLELELISLYRDDNELYFRYRTQGMKSN